MNLEAAIFDCDGVLADTEVPDYEAWRLIYAAHGVELDVREWAKTIGIAKGHDIVDWHTALADVVGPGYDREEVNARRRAHFSGAIDGLAPMPGVERLLDLMAESGVPCAVASNSDRAWVDRVLTTTGLIDRFAIIVTAADVAQPKPAPDVCLLAASRLGAAPENCVAFEDSPRGLTAAHAAGMVTVAVPTLLTRHMDWIQAHYLVDTLESITPTFINRLGF